MRICDKCQRRGDYRPGVVQAILGVEQADLCNSCFEEVRTLIFDSTPKEPEQKQEKQKTKK